MTTPATSVLAAFDSEQFRVFGHRLVDRLAGYLAAATGGARLAILPTLTPAEMTAAWPGRFTPQPAGNFEELLARLVAGANHLHHPRYVGHQLPPTLPMAALCDLAVGLLNNSVAVYEMAPAGAAIERAVVRWMTGELGLGEAADGVMTSGGATGNLTALLAARQARAGYDAWTEGTGSVARLAVLASDHAHYSVSRAVAIMGLGEQGAVLVASDRQYRMRAPALDAARREAERRGLKPIAVVANACSTATGTYDPLEEIADFCQTHGLWLHVDAAHGASAILSQSYRHLLRGIERADSVVWDPHKMMLMPLPSSAVLFRDGRALGAAFDQRASYLFREEEAGPGDLGERTLECSRRVTGFGLYAALAVYGTQFFADYVGATYGLARRFAEMIGAAPDFELAASPDANIVCFRYLRRGATNLDSVQSDIRTRILHDASFYLVQTRLPTGLFLRTTLINPFTSERDLTDLLAAVREAGN